MNNLGLINTLWNTQSYSLAKSESDYPTSTVPIKTCLSRNYISLLPLRITFLYYFYISTLYNEFLIIVGHIFKTTFSVIFKVNIL